MLLVEDEEVNDFGSRPEPSAQPLTLALIQPSGLPAFRSLFHRVGCISCR